MRSMRTEPTIPLQPIKPILSIYSSSIQESFFPCFQLRRTVSRPTLIIIRHSGFEMTQKIGECEDSFKKKLLPSLALSRNRQKFWASEQPLFGMDAEEGVGQTLLLN